MNRIMPKYWIAIITAASFVAGIILSPTVTTAIQPFTAENKIDEEMMRVEQMEKFGSEIYGEIQKLNIELQELKDKSDEAHPEVSDEIASIERQIRVLDTKIDRLNRLSDEIDQLRKEIERLKVASSPLSVSLDRFEYSAGDPLIINGVGLPNILASISLLDPNGIVISQGSTTADSNGMFAFTMQLSSNLAAGNYVIRVSQDGNVAERTFRIVSTQVQAGFTLTTDANEYLRGERVLLRGVADPNVWIDIDIFDSNDVHIVRTSALVNANGLYTLEYNIPLNAALGQYEVKAIFGDKQASAKFSVVTTKTSPPQSSGNITVTTDRSTYNRGDLVTITGKGFVNERVNIFVEPPVGDNFILTANTDDAGNYRTMFAIQPNASTGMWHLRVEQGTYTATATITVI